jgi:hypothetical protein
MSKVYEPGRPLPVSFGFFRQLPGYRWVFWSVTGMADNVIQWWLSGAEAPRLIAAPESPGTRKHVVLSKDRSD